MSDNYNNIFKASLLVALSAMLYGFLGYLGTIIMRENFSISTMLFWRFFVAGCWMLIFVLKNHLTNSIVGINARVLLFMFILGALGYAGSSGFYFAASAYMGTGLAMVVFFSYPIMIALASWLIHRKKMHIGTFMTLIIMTVGLLLLRDSVDHPFSMIGVFFGMASAACYAFYVISSKKFSSISIDSNVLTMVVSFGAALIFLFLAISDHHFSFPYSTRNWVYLLALGILATAIPIQLMLEGLKHVSSMRASIISVLEPLVTLIVGVIVLNESVSNLQVLGGILILGSALLVQFQKEL